MMENQPPPNGPWVPAMLEFATASGAAFLAGYVRAKTDARPFSFPAFAARVSEAVVCGFLAFGISAWMETDNPRLTVGLSAALGLIGTGVISDLVVRWVSSRSDKP